MTTKRIIYARPDGGVSVIIPAPEFMARFDAEAEALAAVAAKAVPPGITDMEIVEAADLPPERKFRDAWRHDVTGGVVIDMPKARAIHAAHIRGMRNAEIAKTDAEQARLNDIGSPREIMDLRVKRQALRDMPASVDLEAAATPEALAALWPAGLERS